MNRNTLFLITTFNEDSSLALNCNIETGKNQIGPKEFLKKLSSRVYLTAPSTQVFLFLDKQKKSLLFRNPNNNDYLQNPNKEISPKKENYLDILENIKRQFNNHLFTYDFLAVTYILDAFKKVRDQDFIIALETGEYGNHYKGLLKEIDKVLEGKTFSLSPDLTDISFKLKIDENKTIELKPEDLSHGELKRLSIFIWVNFIANKNSIILMDEIEIAFHPDWQYLIVQDLETWGSGNQYILATHSAELCQAVTPRHVKDLPVFKTKIEQYGH